MNNGLLQVEELRLHYRTTQGVVQAVDGVTFSLAPRQALAVLGESGCGKSSLARAILRLLPRNVEVYDGCVRVNGLDVMPLDEEQFRRDVRWSKISIVMQAAMNALNPVLRVADQVLEPLLVHQGQQRDVALARVRDVFQMVACPGFHGTIRLRAQRWHAAACGPGHGAGLKTSLVLLDEPTSALDVLTQANIMNVLKRIKRDTNTSFMLITHDIATSSELADQVAVMYAGQLVEISDAGRFFREPLHPYSQKLMASVPRLRDDTKLEYIPGRPPSLIDLPRGCRFAPRCPKRFAKCDQDPPMIHTEDGRQVKCWLYE